MNAKETGASAFHPAHTQPEPTVAILPWSDLIEDFLDSIGISLAAFCNEMTGGWLFGYVEALRLVGIRTIVFCVSARVKSPTRFSHAPTGATICVLPASKVYLRLRRQIRQPYDRDRQERLGDVRRIRRWMYVAYRDVMLYLNTPMGALARELSREHCQAILCQEYEYTRFDLCVALGKWLRIPVFATFQGGDWQLSHFERFLRPMTLKACAGLIIAPQTEINRVRMKYGKASPNIAHIFNPIDLSTWNVVDRCEARAALGISSTARVAVWHGRVDMYRKGLDVLLDAWQRVYHERNGLDLWLLLVGTGDDAGKLQQYISVMQLQGVRWVDEYVLDRAAIRRFLSAADVYTLPSRHEGFPVAPIEAMACGLPVVAADAPGVPDILEGGEAAGGLVVPRGDALALAQVLGHVLSDVAWSRTLGRRARCRVETCFSLEAVGKQLSAFLQVNRNG